MNKMLVAAVAIIPLGIPIYLTWKAYELHKEWKKNGQEFDSNYGDIDDSNQSRP